MILTKDEREIEDMHKAFRRWAEAHMADGQGFRPGYHGPFTVQGDHQTPPGFLKGFGAWRRITVRHEGRKFDLLRQLFERIPPEWPVDLKILAAGSLIRYMAEID